MLFQNRWVRTIIYIIISSALLLGCNTQPSSEQTESMVKTKNYFIYDTFVTVRVFDEQFTDEHFDEIESILNDIDIQMNRQLEDSEISQVNDMAGEKFVAVSEETFYVVEQAIKYAEMSNGIYDPTVGPLVDLWRIGSESVNLPSETQAAEVASLVNYRQVEFDKPNHTIKLLIPGMSLDLGSIAKGHAADRVAAYLTAHGFNSAIIDLGGNIVALGLKQPDGLPWRIGVQSPEEMRGENIGVLQIDNQTIVSSGIYERYFIENGEHYHHIFNTSNGFPVQNNLYSVTIVTEQSIDADALSTVGFVLGLEDGLQFIESLPSSEAIFITKEKDVYITTGLSNIFELTDHEYTLMN